MGDELAEARNVYRLQLGGKRLCEALRKIADGCDDPKAVAKEALNHKAPDPDWNALVLPFIQAEREACAKAERETFYYLCKWVERGLFDKAISEREALEVIAHHPAMPWKNGRWDVDHKPYAAAFYKRFPKATAIRSRTMGVEG